jgi:hypothetical protein
LRGFLRWRKREAVLEVEKRKTWGIIRRREGGKWEDADLGVSSNE